MEKRSKGDEEIANQLEKEGIASTVMHAKSR